MRLRILMTLDAVGGVWRYAMDLGAALAAAGHRVHFAGLGPEPAAAQRDEAQAIGTLDWGTEPLDWMASGPGDLSRVPGWIEGLARHHGANLLHLNLPSQAAGLRYGLPRVVATHSCLATWFRAVEGAEVPPHLSWHRDLTRQGFLNAHRVIAPSAAHARLTAGVYGIDRIATVHNASRTALGAPDEGDGSVVAVARWWDKAKNGALLDAAAGRGAPLTLIGQCDGPDGQRFAPTHAATTGPLPHAATTARIMAASLFVSPSLYEPFGLAALEAARAARPLLLADIPVYREIWDGAARFFDPRDPADLTRRIEALLRSPEDRRALALAARERARAFSPEAQADAMTRLYKEIAACTPQSIAP